MLSELYEINSGISTKKEQAGYGYPFLSFSIVFNNCFLPDFLPDLMNTSEQERKRYSILKDDVFFTRTSETIEELAMSSVALRDYPMATYSGFLKRLRPITQGIVYGKYIAFYFRNKFFRKMVKNHTSLTLRASFNEDFFSYLYVYLPKYEIQQKIGDFLTNLDKKIALNNQIIAKLEEMAKTLYNYWFLQFDFPNDEGKPYATSKGEMKYSDELKQNIPKSFEVLTLGDILQKNSSPFDYSSIEPTIDLSVMPSSSIALNQLNSSKNFSTNLFRMEEGDILFGSIRPYLKKAGIAPCNGVYVGTIYSYKTKKTNDYNFALMTMCRDTCFNYALQVSQGTRMPVVRNDNLMQYKFAYNAKIAKKFNEVLPIKKVICKKLQENQKLAELRDYLLPMLMNGQVKVK